MNFFEKCLTFYRYVRYVKLSNRNYLITNDKKKNNILESLNKKKYVVIKNFITKKECKKIIKNMQKVISNKKIKHWSDISKSDHRVFGAEKISKEIENFSKNSFINEIGSSYIKNKLNTYMVMANKVDYKKNNKGSGGGWHKDSFRKQFKAILYLNDVNYKNGPFELILNSCDIFFNYNLIFKFNRNLSNSRFSNKEVKEILKKNNFKSVKILGKAGTLILVDTSLIHRGKPLDSGTRYALTNYMYPKYKFELYKNKFKPILKKKLFN